MLEQGKEAIYSEPSFSRWNLLFIAVCKFNRFRERQGKELINTLEYNKIGRRLRGGFWILHKVDSYIYRGWLEFCNDPKNRLVFKD